MGLIGCGFRKDAKLVSFCYSTGGGMRGEGSSVEVTVIGDKVYITEAASEYWYQDATVTEYVADPGICDEIAEVFRKYNMSLWNNKKFTNIFVNDGANHTYSFDFSDNTRVNFTSQVYPEKYRTKLAEIHDIIKKYEATATIEPGLVTDLQTSEQQIYKSHPDNGTVELEVFGYRKTILSYRIMNGTNAKVTIAGDIKLTAASGEVVCEQSSRFDSTAYPNSSDEFTLTLSGRLAAGKYTLSVGELSAEFNVT